MEIQSNYRGNRIYNPDRFDSIKQLAKVLKDTYTKRKETGVRVIINAIVPEKLPLYMIKRNTEKPLPKKELGSVVDLLI